MSRTPFITLALTILVFVFSLNSPGVFSQEGHEGEKEKIDFKLLFNQLFALEIRKSMPEPKTRAERKNQEWEYQKLLRRYTYFAPEGFNDIIRKVGQGQTSNEIYQNIDKVLGQEKNRQLISQLNFKKSVPFSLRRIPAVKNFLKSIEENKNRHYLPDENYFASPEAKQMMAAMSAGKNSEGVAVVMIPGFGAHTLKDFIFEEFTKMANEIHGRPQERALLAEAPLNLKYESASEYYKNGPQNPVAKKFDILHPMGDELGNTVGPNARNAKYVSEWLSKLPESYKKKKLIFITYSKGAPIVMDLFRQHPELSERTLAVVTYGGTFQGTGVGRLVMDAIKENFGIDQENLEEIENILEKTPPGLEQFLSLCLSGNLGPLGNLGPAVLTFLPQVEKILERVGVPTDFLKEHLQRTLESNDVAQLLVGTRDLTPLTRAYDNLKYLNNKTFTHPVALFNLSAVTNVKDFTMPEGLREDGSRVPSLVVPELTPEGKVDFEKFSLDAVFLYLSSILGFRKAPSGLFDTQVELAHTKSIFLDDRPLSESLTKEELKNLWDKRLEDGPLLEIFEANGITSLEILSERPRKDLIRKEDRDHLDSIDLGEIRGHHWSSLSQAFKPPKEISEKHHVWPFPRLSYMRALMQTIALYHLVQENGAEQ